MKHPGLKVLLSYQIFRYQTNYYKLKENSLSVTCNGLEPRQRKYSVSIWDKSGELKTFDVFCFNMGIGDLGLLEKLGMKLRSTLFHYFSLMHWKQTFSSVDWDAAMILRELWSSRSHQETTVNLTLPGNCLQRSGLFFSAPESHFEGLSLERGNLETINWKRYFLKWVPGFSGQVWLGALAVAELTIDVSSCRWVCLPLLFRHVFHSVNS